MLKIMITGGAGFIGANLAAFLIPDCQVIVVDNLATGKRGNLPGQAHFFAADVAGPDFISIVAETRPDIIVHLAAQVSVTQSIADPLFDLRNNLAGTVNLLEAARRYPAQKVIFASTAAVYGNPPFLPLTEEHPVLPLSPYGISKHGCEHYLRFYAAHFNVKYTILRFANVYGPLQDAAGEGGVVAVFLRDILGGGKARIYGDGQQTRDFIYVKDIASAIRAAFHGGAGEIFNVGSARATTVNDLFQLVCATVNKKEAALYLPPRAGDIRDSVYNCSKINRVLGWQPFYDLSRGLLETAQWFAGREAENAGTIG